MRPLSFDCVSIYVQFVLHFRRAGFVSVVVCLFVFVVPAFLFFCRPFFRSLLLVRFDGSVFMSGTWAWAWALRCPGVPASCLVLVPLCSTAAQYRRYRSHTWKWKATANNRTTPPQSKAPVLFAF